MANKFCFTLSILSFLALTTLFSSPIFGAKGGNKPPEALPMIITEVLVRDSDGKAELDCLSPSQTINEIIEISGANFPDWAAEGIDPVVTLGDYIDPLEICGLTPDTILAICPTFVVLEYGFGRYECDQDGDFLLSVYTVSSEANYDLTIGAVGPEGPVGPQGPQGPAGPDSSAEIAIELCGLIDELSAEDPPSLCFDCPDGHKDPLELCDDGNSVNGDGCNSDCLTEVCGDGKVDSGEECDDGGTVGGDGCSATCMAECLKPSVFQVVPYEISVAAGLTALTIQGGNFSVSNEVYIDGRLFLPLFEGTESLSVNIEPTRFEFGLHDVKVVDGLDVPSCSDELIDAFQITP